jgi:cell wall-associated NlpC family hydrolase
VWWVLKVRFGYPIYERGASDMARSAAPRITRSGLKCGDIIFFGPDGTASSVSSIYHAGIYLGRGWFIHSTGSSAGVMLASLNTSAYWRDHFAWGRRVLTPAQLIVL